MVQIKLLIGLPLLFFLSIKVIAQQQPGKSLQQLKKELIEAKIDSVKTDAWNALGEYYFAQRTETNKIPDSATISFKKAEQSGSKGSNKSGYQKARIFNTVIDFLTGNYSTAVGNLQAMPDSIKAHVMSALGDVYASLDPVVKQNSDTTVYYYTEQKKLAESSRQIKFIAKSYYNLATYSYKQNRLAEGRTYANKAEYYYRDIGDLSTIAAMWNTMGNNLQYYPKNYADVLFCLENQHKLLAEIKNVKEIAWLDLDIGDVLLDQGRLQEALAKYKSSEKMYLSKAYPNIFQVYTRLYDVYRKMSDFDNAVYYVLEAIKDAEANHGMYIEQLYARLGITYYDLQKYDQSKTVFLKAEAAAKKANAATPGTVIRGMARTLIATGQYEEALKFTTNAVKTSVPNFSSLDSMTIQEAFGDSYAALGQFNVAEKHYLAMFDNAKTSMFDPLLPNIPTGKFYYKTNQFIKARPYLQKVVDAGSVLPVAAQADAHFMLYKIDSSSLDYLSALMHLKRFQQISDSIYTDKKSRQIAELNIKYEVENKNNELLLKDQSIQLKEKDIELLTRQGQLQQADNEKRKKDLLVKEQDIVLLKQDAELQHALGVTRDNELKLNEKNLRLNAKDIQLLKKQAELQDAALQREAFTKKIIIGGIVLLITILGLVYNQYRIKQRSARRINEQNIVLGNLLKEKEWLVREVHHRVKNNLQVMQSLLESQSTYLSDKALSAVQDSQHRMHAMSLIHQKLYQSDNLASIDMEVYIPELVEYLKESFGNVRDISFLLNIEPLQLDVTKAVPLGLIINETVTNSFKHAFLPNEKGKIIVSLRNLYDYYYELEISDSGKGIGDKHITKSTADSLGMKLINGLSKELHANLEISNNHGTQIKVRFVASSEHFSVDHMAKNG